MHYYQFNISDYRKDTIHLTPIEHYIYRTLIDWYYLDEQPIPKITQSVMRRLGLGSDFEHFVINVLQDFFYECDEGWRHRRIDQEIAEYHGKCGKNRTNGKRGGRPKKTQSVISGIPNESEVKANETLTINYKPITNNKDKSLLALVSLGVEESTAKDWIAVRKAKRAPITKTVLAEMQRESDKAGLTIAEAVLICARKSWQGFNAAWNWQDAIPDKDSINGEKKPFVMAEYLKAHL